MNNCLPGGCAFSLDSKGSDPLLIRTLGSEDGGCVVNDWSERQQK